MLSACHAAWTCAVTSRARRSAIGGARVGGRWTLAVALAALSGGVLVWLLASESPIPSFLIRLYMDQDFLRHTLDGGGALAPLAFIALQALQVMVAPIPGATGLLGGFVFGQWLGFVYSAVGLTTESLFAFWIGRRLGAPFVQRLVNRRVWYRMGFIVEAEGAILCFVIYLIPGLPKDIACYLFGLSPMPFWVFAVLSTLGRMPGTWALSAQGATAASGQYIELGLLTALIAAVAAPLYYHRRRLLSWLQRRRARGTVPRGPGRGW